MDILYLVALKGGNKLKIPNKFSFGAVWSRSRAPSIIRFSFHVTFHFSPLGRIKSELDTNEYRNKIQCCHLALD
jgi:hypothetical protein